MKSRTDLLLCYISNPFPANMETQNPKLKDYTVGWICAIAVELAAAITILDEEYPSPPYPPTDNNTYSFGRVGEHNVVIAYLPDGGIGTTWAATVATQMASRFASPILPHGWSSGWSS